VSRRPGESEPPINLPARQGKAMRRNGEEAVGLDLGGLFLLPIDKSECFACLRHPGGGRRRSPDATAPPPQDSPSAAISAPRSVPIYSGQPAAWGWRAWSRSIGIGHIRPADRNIGSSKEPNACGNVSRDECAWFEVRPVEPLRRSERWRVRHRAGSRARSSGCEYDPSGPRKKVRTAMGRQICTVHPTWPSFKGGP
jgi:hypothetical protein